MDRRQFLHASWSGLAVLGAAGCRSNQYARVKKPGEGDMVGSHAAGAETFKPLVDEAVSKMLARHCPPPGVQPVSTGAQQIPPGKLRVCFLGVENKSSEEIGDFKDQLFEIIDQRIIESGTFLSVSKRYIDAGLMETRLRPDQLLIPQNQRIFAAAMEQVSQPFDFLLYASLTSGTTRSNKDMQRDYLLTLELVNIHDGNPDKESATISKGYHHSRLSRALSAGSGT
jgi:hypothetical protein